jgi:HEAT repeat protein
LSTFIDQSEVNDFVSKHFASAGGEWMRSERLLAAADVDPSRIPALVAKLADPQATVRAEGAQGLGSLGPAARIARPELMKALKDSDGLVQRLALEALKHIGPPAKSDVAMLSGAMEEAGPQVQLYVLGALAVLGPEAREALPAVLQRVENPDTAVREQAIRTAGKVAAGDRDRLLPVLEKALKDGHKPVRVAAAEVLTRDVKLSGPDVPRLQELLKHEDGEVRLHGVRGLARIGPAAKEAGKPLAALLREKDPPLRRASLEALMAVGMEPRSAVPELQKLLADTDPEMRRLAIVAVGKLGASGKEAAPALVKLLDDKELRSPALDALAAVGPGAARDAAGPVARLIAEKDLRSRALATLAALKPAGNDAQPAIPKLIEMFEQERSVELRDTAAGILGQMGRTAVPALVRALSHTNPLVRVGAAASLGKAGPQARTAIAALQKAAQTDSITEVRDEATNALARILQK